MLGAESTGKTRLCLAMAERLRARGHRVAVVPELLRKFREQAGQPLRPEAHLAIGQDQERAVDDAAREAGIVIADTTALMVAIYGALLFENDPLYRLALERLPSYTLVLLAGLDLPWVADGLDRQAPGDRERVDALVREALGKAGVSWRVIYGAGDDRTEAALEALAGVAAWAWPPRAPQAPRWQGLCEACGDPDCERRLFSGLTGTPGPSRDHG